MDPMAGADLDIRGIQEEVLLLRMRFALLSLGLICRVCNCRSSSKVHAEAHERSDGHYEVLDARAHHATMMPFHAVPFCTVCGTVPDDVDAHCAGKGHRKALKVEAESWSARFVILSICNELRRRNLEVPEWCPVELSRAQRFRRAAEGCPAKVAAAGVADGDLAGAGLGAATDVAHDGRTRPAPRAFASAGAADRHGVLPGFVRASGADAADVALSRGCGLDRELAEISSGMKKLAVVTSSAVDGLEVVRNEVDVLSSRVLERVKFEDEALSTINVLSEGMQSIAAQRNAFEAQVLGSLNALSVRLDAWDARQARSATHFPLQATVVLSPAVGAEQG